MMLLRRSLGGGRRALSTLEKKQRFASIEALKGEVGRALGWSASLKVDKERVQKFCDATNDWQWIHLDDDRCRRESAFGRAIAPGFLSLSLIVPFLDDVVGEVLVYDWQFVCRAKGAYDYAYFVGLLDDRTDEPRLRQVYADARGAFDADAFFGPDLRAAVLLALASFVMGAATANDHDLHRAAIARLAAAAYDWHAAESLLGARGGGLGAIST